MREEFWQDRLSKISALYEQGVKVSKIAASLDLCDETVRRYVRGFGIQKPETAKKPRRVKKEKIPADLREAITAPDENGVSISKIIELTGYSYNKVRYAANKLNVKLEHSGKKKTDPRSEVMFSMYTAGKTLAEIGEAHGITRERVRQILKKYHHCDAGQGGQKVKSTQKRQSKKQTKLELCMKKHGCSIEEYAYLLQLGRQIMNNGQSREKTPSGAFLAQRSSAKRRGIEWNLKLWDWWKIWEKSGKFFQRGRNAENYVMCRFKDQGGYEAGNVYIATVMHNLTVQPNNPWRNKNHLDYSKVREERRARKEASLFNEVAA